MLKKMEIIVTDSTGKLVGKMKGCALYNVDGKKIYKAKPETTFKQIVQILLSDSQKYVV